jgi:hypothetical protein
MVPRDAGPADTTTNRLSAACSLTVSVETYRVFRVDVDFLRPTGTKGARRMRRRSRIVSLGAASIATSIGVVGAAVEPAAANGTINPPHCDQTAVGGNWDGTNGDGIGNCWVGDNYTHDSNFTEGIQLMLRDLGFYPDSGPFDGKWGPLTKSGVEQLQQLVGLPVDGIVGHQTWGQTSSPVGGFQKNLHLDYLYQGYYYYNVDGGVDNFRFGGSPNTWYVLSELTARYVKFSTAGPS